MSKPIEPRLRAGASDDLADRLSAYGPATDPEPAPEPARLVQEPTRSSRPLRLYVTAAIVLVIALAAGLLAPRLFGSSSSAAVDDDFDRVAENGLGEVDDDTEWEAVTGTYAIEDGMAYVKEENEKGPRTVTVVDVVTTNGRIEAVIGNAPSGWGIVFRYANPFNYWYVQAAPEYGVLNVARLSGGTLQSIGPTALAGLRPGTRVTVILDNANITIEVDGTSVFRLTSDQLLGATKAGLIGVVDPEGASWDEFRATPDSDNPGPATVRLPGDTTTTEAEVDEEEPAEDDRETTTTQSVSSSTTSTAP